MVKHRNPAVVIVLTVITLGIYGIYWVVSTTKELRSLKADAPNPWALVLFIIPLVNIIVALWYYWKYSGAVEEISGFSAVLLFLLWIVFSPAAVVIAQIQLNKKAAVTRPSAAKAMAAA
jgi:RsiW-degrading membrane proteinase PrsW (M82 family)